MRDFHLKIATPDGMIFDGEATAILMRTDSGDVEIMAGHEDYFATLGIGRVKLTANGSSRVASSSGGFVSVKDGKCNMVATTFEFADDIDIKRAKKAKENAEEALRRAKNDKEIRLAKAKLARAISRIRIAEE